MPSSYFYSKDVVVVCSILGMHLFGCKFCAPALVGTKACGRKNFDTLLWAIITVFQVPISKKTTQHLRRVCRKRNFKNKQAESKQIRSLAYGIIKFLRGMTNRLSDLLRLLFIYVTGGF